MRPIWLIEADVFREAAEPLKAEVRRRGMRCHVVRHAAAARPPYDLVGLDPLPDDACVVFYGSHPLMRHLQITRRWVPGGWCDFERLACSAYYPHFREFLLNANSAIVPAGEVAWRADELFAALGGGGEVFVRPDGVEKLFTGQCVSRDRLAEATAPARFREGSRVVVAPARQVGAEWRLVVAGDAVVAGSRYREDGRTVIRPGFPRDVGNFAAEILSRVAWRPDDVFMMDVCESDGRRYLLELNGFSCSGLYGCDVAAVVAAASELAAAAHAGS